MKKKLKMARQGDVLVMAVDAIPAAAAKMKREAGKVVLAHGEATGHTHAFGSRMCLQYAVQDEFNRTGCSWLQVKGISGAVLRHQEHSPISVPPGNYRVIRQQEYIEGELVRVAD